MIRYRFKQLFEAVHAVSQKPDLLVPLLYGLSMNSSIMEPEYQAIGKGLQPYLEHNSRVQKLQEECGTDQVKLDGQLEELREKDKQIIEDTEKFMNEEVEFEPYKIHYKLFPEETFKNRDNMDFWLPLLKDGE